MFMSQCYNQAALHESDKLQLDTLQSIHIITGAQNIQMEVNAALKTFKHTTLKEPHKENKT